SLASTSSVTESAACLARMRPRVPDWRSMAWSSCNLSTSHRAVIRTMNSRPKAIASLCRIAMVCQSARWYVGASGSRGAYGDFLVLHELEVHGMTRGLYAEALDVVGTQVPQEWQ